MKVVMPHRSSFHLYKNKCIINQQRPNKAEMANQNIDSSLPYTLVMWIFHHILITQCSIDQDTLVSPFSSFLLFFLPLSSCLCFLHVSPSYNHKTDTSMSLVFSNLNHHHRLLSMTSRFFFLAVFTFRSRILRPYSLVSSTSSG